MGKVFYYYGTMKSSKTANLLMVYHNYTEKGIKPILVKPQSDTRSGENTIASRVGISEEADYVIPGNLPDYFDWVHELVGDANVNNRPVLIDECQFLSPIFVNELCDSADGLIIMAYGLLTNFGGNLFDGSKAWVERADDIREIKTICDYCGKKATHNLFLVDGKPVFDTSKGDVVIGDTNYKVVCNHHWLEKKQGEDSKQVQRVYNIEDK